METQTKNWTANIKMHYKSFMTIPFIKMHSLGNDFVILDQRAQIYDYSPDMIQKISDRRLGVGCDQLIILQSKTHPDADVFIRIFNADGQEVGACGNATRCIGALLSQENNRPCHKVETQAGILATETNASHQVTVDLGRPQFNWDKIPLAQEVDPLHLPLQFESLKDPVALSVGNPHLVFFVYDVDSIDLLHVGQSLTHHPLFPEGINIEIIEKIDDQTLKMRVYERGAGITPACGTGAAASVIAAQKRGIVTKSAITVLLDGGTLKVDYQDTVKITGHVSLVFQGHLDTSFLQS
ncbi:MAG: diaminopimelate epimerase [Janthinobacterium lividum]